MQPHLRLRREAKKMDVTACLLGLPQLEGDDWARQVAREDRRGQMDMQGGGTRGRQGREGPGWFIHPSRETGSHPASEGRP